MIELNREQIVNALESCFVNRNCKGCPMEGREECLEVVGGKALSLINELTAENERLRADTVRDCTDNIAQEMIEGEGDNAGLITPTADAVEVVMRDRLIELLRQKEFDYWEECACVAEDGYKCAPDFAEYFADQLLANAVIVPPCKVGDKIFFIHHINDVIPDFIGDDTVTKIGVTTRGIMHEVGVDFAAFGKTVFLTQDEAEKALQERRENEIR